MTTLTDIIDRKKRNNWYYFFEGMRATFTTDYTGYYIQKTQERIKEVEDEWKVLERDFADVLNLVFSLDEILVHERSEEILAEIQKQYNLTREQILELAKQVKSVKENLQVLKEEYNEADRSKYNDSHTIKEYSSMKFKMQPEVNEQKK